MQNRVGGELDQVEQFRQSWERKATSYNHSAIWWRVNKRDSQPPDNWREQWRWAQLEGGKRLDFLTAVMGHMLRGMPYKVVDGRVEYLVTENGMPLESNLYYGELEAHRDRCRQEAYGAWLPPAADLPDMVIYNLDDTSPEADPDSRIECKMVDGTIRLRMLPEMFHYVAAHPRILGAWVIDRCAIIADANIHFDERERRREVEVNLYPIPERAALPAQASAQDEELVLSRN